MKIYFSFLNFKYKLENSELCLDSNFNLIKKQRKKVIFETNTRLLLDLLYINK